MSNWCSLNGGIYETDKEAVEIQVEKLLDTYQQALKLQQQGQIEKAKGQYEDLIAHHLVKFDSTLLIDSLKSNQDTSNIETPLSTLKFLVYKNYASLLEDEFSHSGKKSLATQALDNYLKAVRIDPTEHSLWYHIGAISHQLNQYRLARIAYETGIFNNDSSTNIEITVREEYLISLLKNGRLLPMQWKCLEGLCRILYDIKDYQACQSYIDIVCQHIHWELGQQLKQMMTQAPLEEVDEDTVMADNSKMIVIRLDSGNWLSLIKKLLNEYKTSPSHNNKNHQDTDTIDNKRSDIVFVNHPVYIDINEKPTKINCIEVNGQIDEDDTMAEGKESLKRKRDSEDSKGTDKEDENDTEQDEESEAEEKRASLRTSKRQRDKIANEEYSRRKMLDEETQFLTSVQNFFNQVKNNPKLCRPTPWDTLDKDHIGLFWEWFDHKVSELDSNYCWDVNRSNIENDTLLFGDFKTLFSRSLVDSQITEELDSNKLKESIISINKNNSGVLDSLCRTILVILQQDVRDGNSQIMNNQLLEVVTSAIAILSPNFMDQLIPYYEDMSNQCMIILRIAELLVDRLVRCIMKSFESSVPQPNASNKKRITSLSKSFDLKHTDNLMEFCQSWIQLVDNALFDITSRKMKSHINDPTYSLFTEEERKAGLRYWFLKGKLAQLQGEIDAAYSWYAMCREVLLVYPDIIDTKCVYDRILNINEVQKKVEALKSGNYYKNAELKMKARDYTGVIELLEPIIAPKLQSCVQRRETESINSMVHMLAEAYIHVDRYTEAWSCFVHVFSYFVQQLMDYGIQQMKMNVDLSRDEDTEFFRILRCINNVLGDMIHLIEKHSTWSPKDFNGSMKDDMVVILKMSTYYIFRHPDFIPIVNNFSAPDQQPHTPSRITKLNGFNDLLTKAWTLQSYIVESSLATDPEGDTSIGIWADLLQELHDELGEREICGAGGNIFLVYIKDLLTKVNCIKYRRSIYQCYHCLYQIHLAADGDIIEEHHCVHTDLDKESSEPLFALVVQPVTDKLMHGLLLKNDLKDVIDYLSDFFQDLPLKHPHVQRNKNLIDNWLDSEITIHPSLTSMLRDAAFPIVDIHPKTCRLSSVYYKIFWIRGKILRLQTKNRPKSNNEKNIADLEKAVEEFLFHLILNPEDVDGWLELGICFQQLSEEELNWSASNIQDHRDMIAEYQRKACHAYLRALYLSNKNNQKQLLNHSEVFIQFGHLIYSIACPPMNMEALKSQDIKHYLNNEGCVVQVHKSMPNSQSVYKLAVLMYSHALRHNSPNRPDWSCYYMTGKCFGKIGRPAREAIDWFLESIRRAIRQQQSEDTLIESAYMLYSALVKYLYESKIEPEVVEDYIRKEKASHKTDHPDIHAGEHPGDMPMHLSYQLESASEANGVLNIKAKAYRLILDRLEELKRMDKKNWHHRPIYRHAWMQYYVFNNAEQAKIELLQLFTFKPTIKNYITIWKPGFELPGKHYEYVRKYTLFLIQLSKETHDTITLRSLYRKLRRAQVLLLDDKEVFQKAYKVYLEIIEDQLNSNYHADTLMKKIEASDIKGDQFKEICISRNQFMIQEKMDEGLMSTLQDLTELRKLTQSYSPCNEVDRMTRVCYAVMVFKDESDLLNVEGSVSTETIKDKYDTLLLQSKALVNTINTSKCEKKT
ncbi:hypothetical protein BDB01DRAFT_787727 [Pilobolus umbonatus]|nr:hypothetical protein BDB01DRAFT_787727 [Pilobolus umbonatus]